MLDSGSLSAIRVAVEASVTLQERTAAFAQAGFYVLLVVMVFQIVHVLRRGA